MYDSIYFEKVTDSLQITKLPLIGNKRSWNRYNMKFRVRSTLNMEQPYKYKCPKYRITRKMTLMMVNALSWWRYDNAIRLGKYNGSRMMLSLSTEFRSFLQSRNDLCRLLWIQLGVHLYDKRVNVQRRNRFLSIIFK